MYHLHEFLKPNLARLSTIFFYHPILEKKPFYDLALFLKRVDSGVKELDIIGQKKNQEIILTDRAAAPP